MKRLLSIFSVLLILFAFSCVGFCADYGPDVTDSSYASASSHHASGYEAEGAFDNVCDMAEPNRWVSASLDITGWLRQDFGIAVTKTIVKYTLSGSNSSADVKSWTFEGSNNASDWDVLDTQTDISFTYCVKQSFIFANTTAYRYYQLNITANNDDTNYTTVLEMEMMEIAAVEHPTTSQLLLGGLWFKDGKLKHSDWTRLKRGTAE